MDKENRAKPEPWATPEGPAALEAMIARAGGGRGPAPVERWNPPFCGDLDMEIKADGSWIYGGTPIARPALVRLFSSVLRKDEDGCTYLVTPVEKIGIRVEDAHFLAVEMVQSGTGGDRILQFRTNVGDLVEAGPDHPLRFAQEPRTGGVKPYLGVRGRLEALVARPVMYELMAAGEEIATARGRVFAVRSGGAVFPVMSAARLRDLTQ